MTNPFAHRMNPLGVAFLFGSCLFAAACGSATPIGTGTAGASGTGQAGAGSAGTTGGAGSGGTTGGAGGGGSAGVTGGAGTTGGAGAGGMSGHVPQNHRAASSTCSPDRPAGVCAAQAGFDGGAWCHADADCAAGAQGRCATISRGIGCTCSYDTCTTDADCAKAGMPGPCECRPAVQGIVAPMTTTTNVCKGGNCRVDADCGAGGYCSPSLGSCGSYGGVVGYFCHTSRDSCVDDADCQVRGGVGYCRFDPVGGAWSCSSAQCAG